MPVPSYVSGASAQPLLGSTIGDAFDAICAAHPDGLALVSSHQNLRWTYRDLQEKVYAVASGLLAAGLQPGDRVGIWAPNCAEWTIVQFAAAKAGFILVNVNPAYRIAELEFALNKVECKALVLAERFKSSNYIDMLRAIAPELERSVPGGLHAERLPALRLAVSIGSAEHVGFMPFDQLLQHDPAPERLAEIGQTLDFDDPINIQFTSGTTGSPKGATLSHHNILNNGYFVGAALGLAKGERLCIPVPLYHCFGMVMGNLACLTHGATMVYPSPVFDAGATLATIQDERCNLLYGVPTMFIAMLEHPDFSSYDLSTLRTGIMSGAPCPTEIMQRVISDMHMRDITIAYGMTETSPVSFQSSMQDSLERRVTTVGQVHPRIEVKIINENGHIVPRGTPGELCTRGYSVMKGYWDDPERTAEAIDSAGWMHSGDLAVLDDEGFCKIVGRIKDMVIRGGENLYPREIEEFLHRHSAIQDVQIVGVPDAKFGEELCACIIVKQGQQLTEDDVRAFCRGQIAHHKIPRYVRFVDAFPLTISGKVQKFAIRAHMERELGLGEGDRTAG